MSGTYCVEFFLNEDMPLPNGTYRDWFNPDLMLGLSGAGYFLLRLADPACFESVLLIGDRNLKRHSVVNPVPAQKIQV